MAHRQPPQLYDAGIVPANRPRLAGQNVCDVCVVGAGYTGLSAALTLALHGTRVIVLEAQRAGFAASGRNGGQLHIGFRLEQNTLERWLGKAFADDLWTLSEQGREHLFGLIARFKIECDFRPGIFLAAHDISAFREMIDDSEYLARVYGHETEVFDARKTTELLGTRLYCGGRLDRSGGHLHPLKLADALARASDALGISLYEHSEVRGIEESGANCVVSCDTGKVSCAQVILACDASSGDVAPALAPYIGHVAGFQVATAPLDDDQRRAVLPGDVAVADTRFAPDYFRKTQDGRLVFGGGERYWLMPRDNSTPVKPRLRAVYPELADAKLDYAWSGTVSVTRTRMPHMGRLSPRVSFAHGYSGHGLALSFLYGQVLAEAALGNSERFDVLARIPAKRFPGGSVSRKQIMAAGLLYHKFLDSI